MATATPAGAAASSSAAPAAAGTAVALPVPSSLASLSELGLLREFQDNAQSRRMACYSRFHLAFRTFMSEREGWDQAQSELRDRDSREGSMMLKGGMGASASSSSSSDAESAPKTLADMRAASEAQERALASQPSKLSPEQTFQRVCMEVMTEFQQVSKQVRSVIDAFLQRALAAQAGSDKAAAAPSPAAAASARHWSSRLSSLQQLEKLKLELTIHQQMLRNSLYVRAHPQQHGQVHEHEHHHHPHYAHTDARGTLKALKKKKKAAMASVSEDAEEGGDEHKHEEGDSEHDDDDAQELADNAQPFTRHLSALLSDTAHQTDSPFLFPPSGAFPRGKEELAAIAAAPTAGVSCSDDAGSSSAISAAELARAEEELQDLRTQEAELLVSINDILEEIREAIMELQEEEGEEEEEGERRAKHVAAAVAPAPSSSVAASAPGRRDPRAIVVRVPTVSDADALGSAHVRAWRSAYVGLMSASWLEQLSIPERQQQWRKRMQAMEGVTDPALAPPEAQYAKRSLAFFVAEMPVSGSDAAAAQGQASGAAAAGAVVGFISGGPVEVLSAERTPAPEHSAEVTGLNVAPEGWGTGAAQALMRVTLASFKRQGFRHAVLWVTEGNGRALRFYEKEGFVLDGEKRDDQRDGNAFVALRMRRSLDDIGAD